MNNPPTSEDVESQALALAAFAFLNLSPTPASDEIRERDLPPKYETLEADLTAPPGYDEAVQCGRQVHQPVQHVVQQFRDISVQVD